MDNHKYLVIITLLDGQNFSLPDGAPERVEATVFAEARFGKESILRSEPIKLTNSNPEFVTELAWQLDRRSLHQLRVERKAIKLQVFMQTKERKKLIRTSNADQTNGWTDESSDKHKVELIGYTILDLRSAQQKNQPKFQWLPLLNPKFRKSVYNRPEIQLAITLSREGEENEQDLTPAMTDLKTHNGSLEYGASQAKSSDSDKDTSDDSKLFTTCLDAETNSNSVQNDELVIVDNDLIVRNRNGSHYVFDAKHPQKCTIEDCCEHYKMALSIPFGSGLGDPTKDQNEKYYFLVNLFGAPYQTAYFRGLTFDKPLEVKIDIFSTHSGALATYFELNSNLDIKLMSSSGENLGIATIQLNQLCSLDMKCRSIEGLFALQPNNDYEHDTLSDAHLSIGVSIILDRVLPTENIISTPEGEHIALARKHFGNELDEYMFKSNDDTHQLTLDATNPETDTSNEPATQEIDKNELVVEDLDRPSEDDHHFCFTIDLKKFMYTNDQRLIPTLRELVIRYSYPFFGYKDTITTDASIPINASSSIVVSGFCEFNFATTTEPLLTALNELPLNLEILAVDEGRLKDFISEQNELVGKCDINLAKALGLDEKKINSLRDDPLSTTSSVPIHGLDGREIGQLQVYLCLKDLGRPPPKFNASTESLLEQNFAAKIPVTSSTKEFYGNDFKKLEAFISETKQNLESWKEDYSNKLCDEIRQKDNERIKRIYQRIEAKEAKREQEFKAKIDELNNLGNKFKNYLTCVENLEKMLTDSLDQLKMKNAILDNKLDLIDSKISQVITNNNVNYNSIKTELQQSSGDDPVAPTSRGLRSFDNYNNVDNNRAMANFKLVQRSGSEKSSPRRPSLKTAVGIDPAIPVPIRSSSLVRGPTESLSTTSRLVQRTTCVPMGNTNGINSRARSNSARLNLSKETHAKLISLRKEKAELLKRGCKPSDELIQEINSLIEKLAC